MRQHVHLKDLQYMAFGDKRTPQLGCTRAHGLCIGAFLSVRKVQPPPTTTDHHESGWKSQGKLFALEERKLLIFKSIRKECLYRVSRHKVCQCTGFDTVLEIQHHELINYSHATDQSYQENCQGYNKHDKWNRWQFNSHFFFQKVTTSYASPKLWTRMIIYRQFDLIIMLMFILTTWPLQ